MLDRRLLQKIDWMLLASVLSVPLIGLIVLFSAGYNHSSDLPITDISSLYLKSPSFSKQLMFLLIGVIIMVAAASIPSRWYFTLAPVVYSASVTLLILVALFGTVVKGSRRWLDLGPINLQPAELTKMGVILALARILSKLPPPRGGYNFIQLLSPAILFLVPMALIMKQPDLGTALSLGAVASSMILFAGIRPKLLVALIFGAMLTLIPLWHSLHQYQKNRIVALFNSEADPRGTGYHIIQSKIAVGSGELFGKGYLKGSQTQLEFLPEHTTDFIFSVLAEEWGFLGCVCVICMYLILVWMLIRVTLKVRDTFSVYLVVGVTSQIAFHAFVNMGMVVGLLPVVGIPLPMFSYGGSSLLSTLFGIGLVFGVYVRRGLVGQ
jgi:rod shape determining protein RodA